MSLMTRKLYTFKLLLVLGAMALATGNASAAPSLVIFDGFVGYDSVIASKLDEAKSEVDVVLSSKATSGDLNNICVVYALSKNYMDAESICSEAITKAKEENVSRQTLRTMRSNLKIVSEKLQDYSTAAD
jgi:hypothetical protein